MTMVTREYNTISKPTFGFVEKVSSNPKLVDEYNYYFHVEGMKDNPEIQALFPRKLSRGGIHSYENGPWTLRLEYIPLKNAFQHLIEFNSPIYAIVDSLQNALDLLHTHKSTLHKYSLAASVKLYEMYVVKTEREHEAYLNSPAFVHPPTYLQGRGKIHFNGERYEPFEEIWPIVKKKYFTDFTGAEENWAMIHGDCCLSNILMDPMSGVVKFIDMRGSFGGKHTEGIYGHIPYDYAKLLHSVEGCYENIIYDRYQYWHDVGENCRFSDEYNRESFQRLMFGKFDTKTMNYIRAIQATIFIGMCARHAESPEHQRIMYLQGIKLLNEVASD